MKLLQAWRQWSMNSLQDLKIRFESQLSRMSCRMFSTGISSDDPG